MEAIRLSLQAAPDAEVEQAMRESMQGQAQPSTETTNPARVSLRPSGVNINRGSMRSQAGSNARSPLSATSTGREGSPTRIESPLAASQTAEDIIQTSESDDEDSRPLGELHDEIHAERTSQVAEETSQAPLDTPQQPLTSTEENLDAPLLDINPEITGQPASESAEIVEAVTTEADIKIATPITEGSEISESQVLINPPIQPPLVSDSKTFALTPSNNSLNDAVGAEDN
jgi:hypothetical protein